MWRFDIRFARHGIVIAGHELFPVFKLELACLENNPLSVNSNLSTFTNTSDLTTTSNSNSNHNNQPNNLQQTLSEWIPDARTPPPVSASCFHIT
jgi:hypothetical protein